MGLAEFIFWFSFLMIVYTYLGYPLLLFLWARLFTKRVDKKYIIPEPLVSVVIAAYNEEQNIGRRIENLFQQEYPADKMEIIVVSDGSTDRTVEVVEKFINELQAGEAPFPTIRSVRLIKIEENLGKPHALNAAVKAAAGEYLVLTDARQKFEKNAIKELIANFNDLSVGCVSGELVFVDEKDGSITDEMSTYWNLEKYIRKMESAIDSVIGATGAIFAVRKNLFQSIPRDTLLDDVYLPMMVVYQGYRNVFDDRAIAHDTSSNDWRQEKRRKIRTLLGNYYLPRELPWLLVPTKNRLFGRYVSHKILRLFVPIFFILIMISALAAGGYPYYTTFVAGMLVILLSVLHNSVRKDTVLKELSKYCFLFISFNYFALVAFYYFLISGKRKIW